jgi:guanine deaminase
VHDDIVISSTHDMTWRNLDPLDHGIPRLLYNSFHILATMDLSDSMVFLTGYPCRMCLGALMFANIRIVYYSASIQTQIEAGFREKVDFCNKSEISRRINLIQLAPEKGNNVIQTWCNTPKPPPIIGNYLRSAQ